MKAQITGIKAVAIAALTCAVAILVCKPSNQYLFACALVAVVVLPIYVVLELLTALVGWIGGQALKGISKKK